MRLEIPTPYYESPTLENDEIEPFDTEKIGRFAGRVATTIVLTHGYVMPGGEIATLNGAMAMAEVADAAKFRENAQNN
jgi:hypothetical protein